LKPAFLHFSGKKMTKLAIVFFALLFVVLSVAAFSLEVSGLLRHYLVFKSEDGTHKIRL
jgi:hypothetical protein